MDQLNWVINPQCRVSFQYACTMYGVRLLNWEDLAYKNKVDRRKRSRHINGLGLST